MLKELSSSSSFLGCPQCFHELLPAFQSDIIDRIPNLLSFVYMSGRNHFCQWLFKKKSGPCVWNIIKLTVFEIAKTDKINDD